ncbi:Acyl carrier protein [bioreactor metagenome]|uniref:Acyl carrier protein n=1 Tax=bioreactor metagenome TaxID=1076179 RepID=A0A645G6Z5_9ZZZZ
MVFEKVVKILVDYKDLDPSQIKMDTTFEALGLDSLDTVELVMSFEEEFGTTIELNGGINTVADIVTLIEKAIA